LKKFRVYTSSLVCCLPQNPMHLFVVQNFGFESVFTVGLRTKSGRWARMSLYFLRMIKFLSLKILASSSASFFVFLVNPLSLMSYKSLNLSTSFRTRRSVLSAPIAKSNSFPVAAVAASKETFLTSSFCSSEM